MSTVLRSAQEHEQVCVVQTWGVRSTRWDGGYHGWVQKGFSWIIVFVMKHLGSTYCSEDPPTPPHSIILFLDSSQTSTWSIEGVRRQVWNRTLIRCRWDIFHNFSPFIETKKQKNVSCTFPGGRQRTGEEKRTNSKLMFDFLVSFVRSSWLDGYVEATVKFSGVSVQIFKDK